MTPPDLETEIARQAEIAAIFERLEAICPSAKIFTAANLASVYADTAERLRQLAARSPESQEP